MSKKELGISEIGERKPTKKEIEICRRMFSDKKMQDACLETMITESERGEIVERLRQSVTSPFLHLHSIGWILMLMSGSILTTFVILPLISNIFSGMGVWTMVVASIIAVTIGVVGIILTRSTSPSY